MSWTPSWKSSRLCHHGKPHPAFYPPENVTPTLGTHAMEPESQAETLILILSPPPSWDACSLSSMGSVTSPRLNLLHHPTFTGIILMWPGTLIPSSELGLQPGLSSPMILQKNTAHLVFLLTPTCRSPKNCAVSAPGMHSSDLPAV